MPTAGASTIPPFIPGLIIVTLLIVISVFMGWRSYRQETSYGPTRAQFGVFLGAEDRERSSPSRSEKPKLWEVSVDGCGREIGEKSACKSGWEHIMPLSATSFTPEPPPAPPPPISDTSQNPRSPRSPSYLPRLNFLSRRAAPPAYPSPPGSPIPAHRLQLSVIISMPALPTQPTQSQSALRSRRMSVTSSSPSFDGDAKPRPSMSSDPHQHLLSDLSMNNKMEEVKEEGMPDVVFGMVTLPWRKADDDLEAARTT